MKKRKSKPKQCDRQWMFCVWCGQHIDAAIDHDEIACKAINGEDFGG